MNPAKCCFCNADITDVIRWTVVVRKINTIGVHADAPDRKQLRHVCNFCMALINDAMNKLDDGQDSAKRKLL